MQLKNKNIVTVSSLGIIIGFIAAFLINIKQFKLSFDQIKANQYIQYKMFRLVALSLQESVGKLIALTAIISFATVIIWLLGRFFISNIIEFHIKDRNKVRNRFVFSFCSIFFFWGGWAINHYCLSNKFQFISLAVDIIILLITIILGWILIKIKWEKIVLALIIPLGILYFGIIAYNKINVPKGPNVIFIIVDTLRADHLSCYGYDRKTTPNIDRLGLDSILSKNAISAAPWTSPSIGSIFTSQYPTFLGIEEEPIKIDDKFLTLAEIFKENGYKTKGIISHVFVSLLLKFDQGFDSYNEENAKGHDHISSPSVTEKAISFIKKHKNEIFFLFLHYFDPHYDYILHEDYNYYPDYNGSLHSGQSINELLRKAPDMTENDVRYLKALYDSEISFTDEYIGKFLEELKRQGLYDDSFIIFTSDHGEAFCEKGDPWIGHTRRLYQEQIHVPLIIKFPKNRKKEIIDEYLELIDLMPTIVDLAGLKVPKKYDYEGEIISLSGGVKSKNWGIISQTKRGATLLSIIKNGWKFIDHDGDFQELFNLKTDPSESKNTASVNKEKLIEMETIRQEWNLHIKVKKSRIQGQPPKFTEEEKNRLRSLGYIK